MDYNQELLKLRAEVACLESQLDLLQAERTHLNSMLLRCGFPEGISTLIGTVQEVLEAGGIEAFGD